MYNQGGDPDSVAGEFGIHPLYKMLGYFSLIGLLRLHSLLGDYFQAIKVLENVELNKKVLINFNYRNKIIYLFFGVRCGGLVVGAMTQIEQSGF